MISLFLYMQINIIGIIILCVILYFNKLNSNSTYDTILFKRIIYSTIAILIADSGMWLIDGRLFPSSKGINLMFSITYYFLAVLIPYLWLIYCDYKTNENHHSSKRVLAIYSIPFILFAAMLIFNLKNKYLFSIDDLNVYHRGELFLLQVFISLGYLLCAAILSLIKAGKEKLKTTKHDYRLTAFFIIPPFIGGIIQTLYFGVSLIWICTVLSILLIYLNKLYRQIYTDSLTGINNRHRLNNYLLSKIDEISDNEKLYIIMIDIDDFKKINDTYGHIAGDNALVKVANILKDTCRNNCDFLARYGGDEFTLVCLRKKNESIQHTISLLLDITQKYNLLNSFDYCISLSIGYSVFEKNDFICIDELIATADKKMYHDKKSRRSTVL